MRNTGGGAVGNVEMKFYYADVGTIGISGFDPNDDGDPADGNFNYIDSYFVPVVGPSGSPQATSVAVVNWNVPVPVTDHWCVGIGIVAPNPPNAVEAVRINNRAFKNFFTIVVALSEVRAFRFFVYPNPRRPREPFDLEFVRKGLPRDFQVELGVDDRIAEKWFQRAEGFVVVKEPALENLGPEGPLQGGEREASVRLTAERGVLRGIVSPDGKRIPARIVIRGPRRLAAGQARERLLVVNANDAKGPFGGLTLNVVPKAEKPKPKPAPRPVG